MKGRTYLTENGLLLFSPIAKQATNKVQEQAAATMGNLLKQAL